jgi:hypothetical protein
MEERGTPRHGESPSHDDHSVVLMARRLFEVRWRSLGASAPGFRVPPECRRMAMGVSVSASTTQGPSSCSIDPGVAGHTVCRA